MNRAMGQTAAIIDYGSGNLRSVQKAFERAADVADVSIRVTAAPEIIAAADRVILPGVGAFAACMTGLSSQKGVLEALQHAVLVEERPFLGICVGMQLLADRGREFGEHPGLGWIIGEVTALPGDNPAARSPHMGWNTVAFDPRHPVFDGLDGEAFYFAHSYHFAPENKAHRIGVTTHGDRIAAAVGRDNILGVQFHPEKSQRAGLKLFENFLCWAPT